MHLRFFTIPIHDDGKAADDLNRFLSVRQVASVERYLVQDGANSAWTVCVTYIQSDGATIQTRRSAVDYREVLEETDFAVYAQLRSLRKELAEKQGVPAYALIAHVGPVLDRGLVYDTYACRKGKGSLAAVRRCQQHVRRFPWYAKIDIRGYFASIDHGVLKKLLQRRFRDAGLLTLMDRIVGAHRDGPGKGLPIGALTSQHFANFYLSGLDRFLLENRRVSGVIRYMDDVVWWCESRERTREVLRAAAGFLSERLMLSVKDTVQINRSARGVTVCGFRVLPGAIRLSRRRRCLYAKHRERWEDAYAAGRVDARALQAGYASALAITLHADATAWRREQLRRRPVNSGCDV